MATNKYNEIEIQTAKNLLEEGYKWLVRENYGKVYAYTNKPHKNHDWDKCYDTWWLDTSTDSYLLICTENVPIFQNIRFEDKEPTSIESIVYPQILDDAERKYLSAVIKPFRKKIKHIVKMRYDKSEFIFIRFDTSSLSMPYFDIGTMYKGMEIGKKYTLEELGL